MRWSQTSCGTSLRGMTMSECERIERKVSLTLEYVGCAEHGHMEASDATLSSGGIDPFQVADDALSVLEESVAFRLMEEQAITNLLSYQYEWAWSSEVEELPDRAKKRVAKLLAQQFLLSRVAGRGYQRNTRSELLRFPDGMG